MAQVLGNGLNPSKLIYADSFQLLQDAFGGSKDVNGAWQDGVISTSSSGNSAYYSIALTKDGYLATHGQVFRISALQGGKDPGMVTLHYITQAEINEKDSPYKDASAGQFVAIDGSGNPCAAVEVIQTLTNSNDVVVTQSSADKSSWNVKLEDKSEGLGINEGDTSISKGSGTATTGAINIPTITVNKQGIVTAISDTAIDAFKVKIVAAGESDKVYLTGHTATTSVGTELKSTSVTVEDGTLKASNVLASKIYKGSEIKDDNEVVTKSEMTTQLTSYFTFKGTWTPSAVDTTGDLSTPSVGENYVAKVGDAFRIASDGKVVTVGTPTGEIVAAGDMIICTAVETTNEGGTTTPAQWTVLENNIDRSDLMTSVAIKYTGDGNVVSDLVVNDKNEITGTKTNMVSGLLIKGNKVKTEADGTAADATVGSALTTISTNNTTPLIDIRGGDHVTTTVTAVEGANPFLTIDFDGITASDLKDIIFKNAGSDLVTYDPATADVKVDTGYGIAASVASDTVTFTHGATKVGETAISTQPVSDLYKISTDAYGHVLVGDKVVSIKNPNKIVFKAVSATDSSTNVDFEYDGSAAKNIKCADFTHLTVDADGNLTISSDNTWREVKVYQIASGTADDNIDQLLNKSIGTNALLFSKTFTSNATNQIDLMWTEITTGEDGTTVSFTC